MHLFFVKSIINNSFIIKKLAEVIKFKSNNLIYFYKLKALGYFWSEMFICLFFKFLIRVPSVRQIFL